MRERNGGLLGPTGPRRRCADIGPEHVCRWAVIAVGTVAGAVLA
ncbi:hypothetical protein Sme01_31640 [Sphaerisporangium melleum]|uniref:Uncharacterized protein n=1 Tax=Sphaerisporangium melleum TaxID=321316 RepID=A0A917R9K3_9ACTN|nr:hypothetical protein [Sphaerisporangium melleum]GGK96176.1 hypothetical protein GCM10007964_43060 [Sphaerisporangium melleum]GII70688.1 hypothetical protein Sme01_31640 [Sphaerisporangium melleum]